jgi:signal transduction histidine kinase
MRLSKFINEQLEEILTAWESFARRLLPATEGMSSLALRDHAKGILRAVALDMETNQTAEEQTRKSMGLATTEEDDSSAASLHGLERQANEFSMSQLTAEFRALRATVLRLWLPHIGHNTADEMDEMVRFNEAIDQALGESVVSFSCRTENARDMFLAILGHDLRAPLASVSAAGQALRHPRLLPAQVEKLGTLVIRGSTLMSQMVEDLTDYTRTQLGMGLSITGQHLDLREACAWAIEDAGSAYPDCDFELVVACDLRGTFDKVRLHRLLTNLLVNAAKHGKKGTPVTVNARRDSDAFLVGVTNQGPVIPATSLKAIFKPLVQLPHGGGEALPGASMGLGLFIAREIAVAHGGEITVTSDMETGTTFLVRLPCRWRGLSSTH